MEKSSVAVRKFSRFPGFYGVSHRISFFLLFLFSLSLLTSSSALADNRETLQQAKKILQVSLHKLNNDVASAAQKISSSGFSGDGTRQVLRNLCESNPAIVSCYTTDPDGKVLMVEPEKYKDIEKVELGNLDYFQRMKDTRGPQAMQFYRSLEDVECTSVVYPVFRGKTLQGALMVQVNQKCLLDSILTLLQETDKTPIWIINTDNTIIYPEAMTFYSKNLVKNPPFSFNDRFEKIAWMINKKAVGEYTFTHDPKDSQKPFPVTLTWDTISFCGVPWRLMASHNLIACLKTPDPSLEKEKKVLRYWRDGLQKYFDDRNADAAKTATMLSSGHLEGNFARDQLRALYSRNSRTVAYCYITDAKGKIVTTEPSEYKILENTSLNLIECTTGIRALKMPAFTHIIKTPDGKLMAYLESPILGKDGSLLGSVGLAINTRAVVNQVAENAEKMPWFIVQTDGLIIHSGKKYYNFGENLKNWSMFSPNPGNYFIGILNKATDGFAGVGHFTGVEAWDQFNVLVWTTVSCNGIQWRIVERKSLPMQLGVKKYPYDGGNPRKRPRRRLPVLKPES